jgi:hypothetical protein
VSQHEQLSLFDLPEFAEIDRVARQRGKRLSITRDRRRPQNPYLKLVADDEPALFDLPHC